jgi:hypothetical protein
VRSPRAKVSKVDAVSLRARLWSRSVRARSVRLRAVWGLDLQLVIQFYGRRGGVWIRMGGRLKNVVCSWREDEKTTNLTRYYLRY